MDKRSWPWKKKSSVAESGQSSPPEANDKIKNLNEKLLAADDFVQQHVKVAEEAVSGWEKAKADYISVRQELDSVMEQKQAAEERISHLDGALKQCMQHLRQVREEQEEKVHEAIMKKTRDWERLRMELEERLADSDQQVVEAQHQNSLLYKTVREHTDAVTQLGQARSKAEAELEKLKVRFETCDKENSALKYEVIILKKELEIRTQEKEINKKAADLASRQHLDDIKKLNRLEAECQRLRNLVRKKLPGPGALAKMKMELDGSDADRRRSGGKSFSSLKSGHGDSIEEENNRMSNKKHNEFQSSRSMCARVNGNDKHSTFEGQFPKSPRIPFNSNGLYGVDAASSISLSVSKEPSQASMSEDGNDDERSVADSWASALISELASLQKDKTTPQPADKEHLDSIDDFIEIERLVSLPPEKQTRDGRLDFASKEAELQEANKLCMDVQKKLSAAEEQLNLLRSENVTNELKLFTLQQSLFTVLEDSQKADPLKVLEDVRNAVLTSQCSSVDGIPVNIKKLSNGNSSHIEKPSVRHGVGPELPSVVCKVVRLVEDLASEIMTQRFTSSEQNGVEANGGNCNVYTNPKPRPVELERAIRNFITISNQYLDGKADVPQFITELSSVLSQIKLDLRVAYRFLESKPKSRPESVQVTEPEVLSDTGSPVSRASNSDASEAVGAKGSAEDDTISNSKALQIDEELRKVRAEKAALESHMRAEFSRMASIEQMLPQLKEDKSELESMLQKEREKLEKVKEQLSDAEQLVASLRVRLASTELSRNMAEENLSSSITAKAKLESLLEQTRLEVAQLQAKLKPLETTAELEHLRNEQLQRKVEELEELLQKAKASGLDAGAALEAGKTMKEQEITDAAEKLAECQRTILVLGKQLKNIASVQDGVLPPLNTSSTDKVQDHRRNGNSIGTIRVRQRMSSDPSDLSNFDDINADLISDGGGKKTSDRFRDEVSSQDLGAEIKQHVPKPFSVKALQNVDLTKSLNMDPSSSPRKHGSSLSRFFSRHKHAS